MTMTAGRWPKSRHSSRSPRPSPNPRAVTTMAGWSPSPRREPSAAEARLESRGLFKVPGFASPARARPAERGRADRGRGGDRSGMRQRGDGRGAPGTGGHARGDRCRFQPRDARQGTHRRPIRRHPASRHRAVAPAPGARADLLERGAALDRPPRGGDAAARRHAGDGRHAGRADAAPEQGAVASRLAQPCRRAVSGARRDDGHTGRHGAGALRGIAQPPWAGFACGRRITTSA